MFINDGRFEIENKELQTMNKSRINCEYIEVLVNGYPAILVRTTKKISKGDTLWIWYGPQYHLVMEA